MNKVLILLSTYNGEKFLREQLDSLYAQKGVDVHILVRDDGSKDNTVGILREYEIAYGKITILIESNIGVSRSFYRLMQYALFEMETFDYYSFCDQDDVWFEYKLEKSCCQIDSSTSQPQLFYAPAVPVDDELIPLKFSTIRVVNCLGANIASNHSLGCTQVFNRALLERIVKICKYAKAHKEIGTYYPLHDAWSALVAYSIGKVIIGEVPLMFYRQHGGNVVGSSQSTLKNLITRINRYTKSERKKSTKCRIILELLNEEIPNKNRALLEKCAYNDKSFSNRMKLAFTKDIYHYGFLYNIGIFLVVITNRF